MILRLDHKHKLVLKNANWTLYKLQRASPYSKEKYDEMVKKGIKQVIMTDANGEKAFGVWKRINQYPTNSISAAVAAWLYSVLDEKYAETEVTIAGLKKILGEFETSMKNCIMLARPFKFDIKITMPDVAEIQKYNLDLSKNVSFDKNGLEELSVESAGSKRRGKGSKKEESKEEDKPKKTLKVKGK